jgi:hypothetical protein
VVKPVTAKPVPDTCIWLTFSAAVPVLLAVTACEPIMPTEAFTVTLFGFTEICGAPAAGGGAETGVDALLTVPAQPEVTTETARMTKRNTNTVPRALREDGMVVDFSLELKFGYCELRSYGIQKLRDQQPGGDHNQEVGMLVRGVKSGQLVPRTGFGKKRYSYSTRYVEKKWKHCELVWQRCESCRLLKNSEFVHFAAQHRTALEMRDSLARRAPIQKVRSGGDSSQHKST